MIPVELIEDLTAAAEIRVYHRKAGYPLSGVQVGSSKKRLASLQRRRQSSRPRQSFCYGHGQKVEDTGPLSTKRMPTADEEFLGAASKFIDKAVDDSLPRLDSPQA
jgi:hypothetical protein